ncbi:creatininase family protein [Devosia sp.]|uniref:creatininase family protein n=1 Tax=Devosia sp. TaxID=1871048 RepID=UPI00326685FC
MGQSVDFARASWPDIAAAVDAGVLAVLAIGACEQHGAHLPLTTDTDLAHGVARRIAAGLDALLLPPITYGDAWNNEAFTGTISLSPATLRAMIEDIGAGCRRIGAKGLVIINGHFGNREPIALAARTLLAAGLPVIHLDYPRLEALASQICDSEPAGPGFYHADEVETAMMLVLVPEVVDLSRAAPEYPDFPPTFGLEPMQLRAFNASGVFGDPRPATAAKGEALIAGIVEESLRLITLWRERHYV